jgi:hypothetical protein
MVKSAHIRIFMKRFGFIMAMFVTGAFAHAETVQRHEDLLVLCGDAYYRSTTLRTMHLGWKGGKEDSWAVTFDEPQTFPSSDELNAICAGSYNEDMFHADIFQPIRYAVRRNPRQTFEFKNIALFGSKYRLHVGQKVKTTQEHCGGAMAEITDISDNLHQIAVFVQLRYDSEELNRQCRGGSYCNAFGGDCIELAPLKVKSFTADAHARRENI